MALFRAVDARTESATIENELAMIYLGLGNLQAAGEHAQQARVGMERWDDQFELANVTDTEARIALARGDLETASQLATESIGMAERLGNAKATVDGLLTVARIARERGDARAALETLERAAAAASAGPNARLRTVLSEWSEVLAELGDHAKAYELSRRALALG